MPERCALPCAAGRAAGAAPGGAGAAGAARGGGRRALRPPGRGRCRLPPRGPARPGAGDARAPRRLAGGEENPARLPACHLRTTCLAPAWRRGHARLTCLPPARRGTGARRCGGARCFARPPHSDSLAEPARRPVWRTLSAVIGGGQVERAVVAAGGDARALAAARNHLGNHFADRRQWAQVRARARALWERPTAAPDKQGRRAGGLRGRHWRLRAGVQAGCCPPGQRLRCCVHSAAPVARRPSR